MKRIVPIIIAILVLLAACASKEPSAPRNMVEEERLPRLLFAEPAQVVAPAPRPAEELYADLPDDQMEDPAGAVFDGFNIEMTSWYVCVPEAKVYSNPYEEENFYLTTLTEGTPVTVRELDLGTRTMAAIEVAKYIKLTNLCPVEG